jgi:3-oxoacyl-(acyl-carrier-protein) synthase
VTTRAVLTGVGVVAPTGIGKASYWRSTLGGRSAIKPLARPDARRSPVAVAGEITGFEPADWMANKLRVQTDRWTWFALAAAEMALDDAGLVPAEHPPFHLSVVTASGSGGNEFGQRETQALWREHPSKVSAFQSIAWFYAASTGQLSIRHGLTGGCGVVAADGAGGLDALAQARRLLRRGSKAVLVGGTEAPLSPFALACQAQLRTVYGGSNPDRAYRPFHPEGSGFVPGEGGALMVLEDRSHAAERGARMYAELLGHAATHDAHHHTDAAPDGVQLARAITTALRQAGRTPDEVDVVFADGAGDPGGDRAEAAALRRVFGPRLAALPVTVPKSGTGRLTSGAGALDTVAAALSLRSGVLPPTAGADADAGLERYGIRLVTRRLRPVRLRTAVVVARGTGGFNSAVVLGALDLDAS